jgi:hypothetical protein
MYILRFSLRCTARLGPFLVSDPYSSSERED